MARLSLCLRSPRQIDDDLKVNHGKQSANRRRLFRSPFVLSRLGHRCLESTRWTLDEHSVFNAQLSAVVVVVVHRSQVNHSHVSRFSSVSR